MSASGVRDLLFIGGTYIMDQYIYLEILINIIILFCYKLSLGSEFIFQQDNGSKHTPKRVKEWLIHNVSKQL